MPHAPMSRKATRPKPQYFALEAPTGKRLAIVRGFSLSELKAWLRRQPARGKR